MNKLGQATVEIVADNAPFRRTLHQSRDELGRFVGASKGTLAGLGLGFGLGGGIQAGMAGLSKLSGFLSGAVTKAADLGEVFSKTRTVLGADADVLIAKADELSSKFGIVRAEALAAGSNIALIAKGAGLSTEAAAKLSAEMVQLASDGSSFFNVSMEDSLEKIRAGLVGESEPLRAFGVLLSEAAVKAEAARMGLGGLSRELSEGEKVQARAALIFKGMADANGDLERTADSTSNKLRKLNGQWEEMQTLLGEKLLPVVDDLIPLVEHLGQTLESVADSGALESMVAAFDTMLISVNEIDGKLKGLKIPGAEAGSEGFGLSDVLKYTTPAYWFSKPSKSISESSRQQAAMGDASEIGKQWNQQQAANAGEVGGAGGGAAPAGGKAGKTSPAELISQNKHVLNSFFTSLLTTPLEGNFMTRAGSPAARLNAEDAAALSKRSWTRPDGTGRIERLTGEHSILGMFSEMGGGLAGAARQGLGGWMPQGGPKRRFDSTTYSDAFSATSGIQSDILNSAKDKEDKAAEQRKEQTGYLKTIAGAIGKSIIGAPISW